jgi:hypothetical protein
MTNRFVKFTLAVRHTDGLQKQVNKYKYLKKYRFLPFVENSVSDVTVMSGVKTASEMNLQLYFRYKFIVANSKLIKALVQ